MDATGKAVAWTCILSTLLMGCYSSTLIDAKGDEKEKIYTNEISYVITEEGRKYVFETPPVIRRDTLAGEATIDYGYIVKREVAIPLAEFGYVSIAEYNATLTVVGIVAGVVFGGIVVMGLFMPDFGEGPFL